MSRKTSMSLNLIILLPDELGALVHHLRAVRACAPGSEEWAREVGNALDAAEVAFADAIASDSDTVMLALGSPALCKIQRRGDKGPLDASNKEKP